jgi:hypothetical protein
LNSYVSDSREPGSFTIDFNITAGWVIPTSSKKAKKEN